MQETLENKLVGCEEVSDIAPVLEDCFASDIDLLNKYHIESPAVLHTCVERTLKDLLSCDDIIFYKLYENSKIIGYFCKETDKYGNKYLTGFFLKPEYRGEKHKSFFWRCVKSEMKGVFYAGVYRKNVRAEKFLKKYGELFFEGNDSKGNSFVSYKII